MSLSTCLLNPPSAGLGSREASGGLYLRVKVHTFLGPKKLKCIASVSEPRGPSYVFIYFIFAKLQCVYFQGTLALCLRLVPNIFVFRFHSVPPRISNGIVLTTVLWTNWNMAVFSTAVLWAMRSRIGFNSSFQ